MEGKPNNFGADPEVQHVSPEVVEWRETLGNPPLGEVTVQPKVEPQPETTQTAPTKNESTPAVHKTEQNEALHTAAIDEALTDPRADILLVQEMIGKSIAFNTEKDV